VRSGTEHVIALDLPGAGDSAKPLIEYRLQADHSRCGPPRFARK